MIQTCEQMRDGGEMNMSERRSKTIVLVDGGDPQETVRVTSLDLTPPWESFDIRHELTAKGIQQFVADYKSTLNQSA